MATLVSDLINGAFYDLEVIAVGESITAAMTADALLRLNQILGSLGAEGLMAFNETLGSFALSGATGYTMGVGGTWNTAARAQKIVSWRCVSGVYTSGGAPLSLADFARQAQDSAVLFDDTAAEILALVNQLNGEFIAKVNQLQGDITARAAEVTKGANKLLAPFFTAVNAYAPPTYTPPTFASAPTPALSSAAVPIVVGADSAYPLLNVRVFPPVNGINIEVAYWSPIASFATAGDTVSMPAGWEKLLRALLAIDLYPQYKRRAGLDAELAKAEQQARTVIMQQNAVPPRPTAPAAPKVAPQTPDQQQR